MPRSQHNRVNTQKTLRLRLSFGGYSATGVKTSNDDAFTAFLPSEHNARKYKGGAACIADGVSCSANAQEASQTAVTNFIADYFSTPDFWDVKQSASKVISAINSWLFQQGMREHARSDGFVTTFSALIIKSHTAHILHAGDSRVYLLRENQLEQLTQDHCYQGGGDNYLTRSLGIDRYLDLDYRSIDVKKGDRFLLTTDGVHEVLDEEQLLSFSASEPCVQKGGSADTLESLAKSISEAALNQGSQDNVSCLFVHVDALPEERESEIFRELTELKIPPALAVGNKIDQFEITRILHVGTRSHVYLARDINTDQRRVLKMPSLNFVDDIVYLESFAREQWIGRKLSHSHIMKIYPPTEGSQFLYHICEYIEGKTLRQWMIDNSQPDLDQVRRVLEGMIAPVRALHRGKMVHCDLKPENFIINRDGVIKLIDFGTLQIAGVEEIRVKNINDSLPVGDIGYIAPECLEYGLITHLTDLFSVATIIYEMLTGKLPYAAIKSNRHLPKNSDKWQYIPLGQFPELKDKYPFWVNAVLKKALSPNPKYRYQAMSEFNGDLKKPSADILRSEKYAPLVERNPLRFWKIMSLLLFVVVVLQWFYLFS